MEAERKTSPIGTFDSVDEEAARIRNVFLQSFPQQEGELERLIPENFAETMARDAKETESVASDEFDWSITLANVGTIIEAHRSSRAMVLASERRAVIAEAKAAEALHWLRLLHEAVLKGLPNKASQA